MRGIPHGRPPFASRTVQMAFRLMRHLAARQAAGHDGWFPQALLAHQLGTSAPSLGQIVHRLRKAGLLSARRGPSGGVRVARPASEIALAEILCAFERAGPVRGCVLGLGDCSEEAQCIVHPMWSAMRANLEEELGRRTLFEIAGSSHGEHPAAPPLAATRH